ncbi:IS110 family transposase [Actinopolymorpha rutila]|uniref:IS110 family transposase n=1 Tax=Actinopolymorpha rutila TaxID=446787 RepID=UPI003B51AA05
MQAGWDWARSTHSVAVTDERGRLVASWRLAHGEEELAATLRRLAGLCPPADLAVGIEARTGLVVERLLAAGHPVVAVHPNAFHAARPRWGASGAKSDAGDASSWRSSFVPNSTQSRRPSGAWCRQRRRRSSCAPCAAPGVMSIPPG